jgi:hypothetical protein
MGGFSHVTAHHQHMFTRLLPVKGPLSPNERFHTELLSSWGLIKAPHYPKVEEFGILLCTQSSQTFRCYVHRPLDRLPAPKAEPLAG